MRWRCQAACSDGSCWHGARAELSCHRWSWAAWVAGVHHDPPDAQQGQWAAATRALLWEVPEFDRVRFCSPCTGQWWQVRFGVCWGRCIILWAMEHNTLSENAFQGNLGAESSCAIECCTSYCSDGPFFLLVVTLSCNIILIWGLKKKKLQGCSRRSRRTIWKKCNFIPIIFCHWIMLAEKLLSMPIRISLQVNLQNKVILGKSGRNSLLAGGPVPNYSPLVVVMWITPEVLLVLYRQKWLICATVCGRNGSLQSGSTEHTGFLCI